MDSFNQNELHFFRASMPRPLTSDYDINFDRKARTGKTKPRRELNYFSPFHVAVAYELETLEFSQFRLAITRGNNVRSDSICTTCIWNYF